MSQMPPEGAEVELKDLVTFARYQLSREKHVLMKDPIWGNYTDEEILAEYYALTYDRSEDSKKEFESQLIAADEAKVDWMEVEMAKNREIIDKIRKEGKQGDVQAKPASPEASEEEEIPLDGFDFEPTGA